MLPQRLSTLFAILASLLFSPSTLCTDPSGHLQPLGHHRAREGDVEMRDDIPSPTEFFHEYVLASKPVIFRGAAKVSQGFHLWTDDYIRKHYGQETVKVDYGKKENRARSADDMSFSEFLDIYNSSARYLIDTLPEKMWSEFSLPECLLCGGFTKALQDVVLWYSSGGTKSHLHNDKVENIHCQMSGEKKWFFVDEIRSRSIIMDHDEGDYCSVYVDKVDMFRYPFLQDLPWWSAHVRAGDCIYVPYGWAHQVTSISRNIAVNIWWSPDIRFNASDCKGIKQPPGLSNYKFTYGEMLRFQAIQVIERYGGSAGFAEIHPVIVHEHSGDKLITKERFALLDTNNDDRLTARELRDLPPDVIEEAFGHAPPGEVNIIGKSKKVDKELTGLLEQLPKQPPHIEEFLLRYEKTEEEMEKFLEENELPELLRSYLMHQMRHFHVPEHREL